MPFFKKESFTAFIGEPDQISHCIVKNSIPCWPIHGVNTVHWPRLAAVAVVV
jgi:hypothetical protein